MPPRSPRFLTCLAQLDRSFESARYQERFLATAFETALPIIRRRSDRTGPGGASSAPPLCRKGGRAASQGR